MISLSPRRIAIDTVTYDAIELQYTGITEVEVRKYVEDNPPPGIGICTTCVNLKWDQLNWMYGCDENLDIGCNKPCSSWISRYYTMDDFINDLHALGVYSIPMDTPQEMVEYIENLLFDAWWKRKQVKYSITPSDKRWSEEKK